MCLRPILLAAASVLTLAACSGEPFVDWSHQGFSGGTLNKVPKVSPSNGQVQVCYGEGDQTSRLLALAQAECEPFKMKAVALYTKRNECTMQVPHRIYFQCFDPEMRLSNGQYINPWSEGDVKLWWEERRAEKQGRKLAQPIPPVGEGPFGRLHAAVRPTSQDLYARPAAQPADPALGGVSSSPAGK